MIADAFGLNHSTVKEFLADVIEYSDELSPLLIENLEAITAEAVEGAVEGEEGAVDGEEVAVEGGEDEFEFDEEEPAEEPAPEEDEFF